MPAFWILDVATPDGRDGLYGLATTTRAGWWASDFGRMYSGRGVTWGMEEMSGDAPVSLAYRHDPRAWFVLGARGTLLRLGDDAAEATLPVTAPLRRLRPAGDELVAVGAGGQIFRGRDLAMTLVPDLIDEERFFTDVAATGAADVCVVGRRGEVFHFDGVAWRDWSPGGADLHVVGQHQGAYVVGGDGGRVLRRDGDGWAAVEVPTEEPVIGLAARADELWVATPSAVFRGDGRRVEQVGPSCAGGGGQLVVGDGVVYCASPTQLRRWTDAGWETIAHPDQRADAVAPWPSLGADLDAATTALVDPAAHLGGTLFTEDMVDDAALARWCRLSRSPRDARAMLAEPGMYRVLEVEGDLHVAGDLSTFAAKLVGLVVHGDLTVDGTLSDCDYPATLTLVGGAVHARTIITSGQLEVAGAVTCEHLIGDYNDYGAVLHGPVAARLFAPEYHHFEFGGPVRIGVGFGTRRFVDTSPRQLEAVLHPALLRGDGDDSELVRKALLTRLRAGEVVWRGPPPPLTLATPTTAKRPGASAKARPKTKATSAGKAKGKTEPKVKVKAKAKPKAKTPPKGRATPKPKAKPTPKPKTKAKPKPKTRPGR